MIAVGSKVRVVRALDEAGEEYLGKVLTVTAIGYDEPIGYDYYTADPGNGKTTIGFYGAELEAVA